MNNPEFECKSGQCRPDRCYLLNNLKFQYDKGGWDNEKETRERSTAPGRKLGGYMNKESTDKTLYSTEGFRKEWHCAQPEELLS